MQPDVRKYLERRIAKLEKRRNGELRTLASMITHAEDLKRNIAGHNTEISSLRSELKALGTTKPSTKCKGCGRPLSNDLDDDGNSRGMVCIHEGCRFVGLVQFVPKEARIDGAKLDQVFLDQNAQEA